MSEFFDKNYILNTYFINVPGSIEIPIIFPIKPTMPFYDEKNELQILKLNNIVIGNGKSINTFEKNYFLIDGQHLNNYYHLVFEYFPSFLHIQKYVPDIEIMVVDTKDTKFNFIENFAIDLFKNISIDINKNRIFIDDNTQVIFNNVYSIKEQNCYETARYYKTDFLYKIVRNFFEKDLKSNLIKNKIYISRKDSFNRIIEDENVIEEYFQTFNINSIIISKMNTVEKINLFFNSKLIIGQSGSNLSNLIFCRPKTKIFELNLINDYYYEAWEGMANFANADYTRISIRSKLYQEKQFNGNDIVNKLKKLNINWNY